jgi:hypothetical protein
MFTKSLNPKRTGLQVLIVSVIVSAALASFSLIRGEFSDTDGKILLTALSVAAASVLTLANGMAIERERSRLLAMPGIVVSIAGFALLIFTIWNDFDFDGAIKLSVSAIIASVMLTHWTMVSLVRIPANHRWLQVITYPLSGLLAAFLISAVWGRIEGGGIAQLVGVVAIVAIAATILLPILQRLSSPEDRTRGTRRVSYCPCCGHRMDARHGRVTCASCNTTFRVQSA